MDSKEIKIKYAGKDADMHFVDMKLLGRSLQGYDQIISSGVIFLIHRRIPKRGERSPILVKAYEPRVGTLTIDGIMDAVSAHLPLFWPLLVDAYPGFLSEFVSYVFKRLGGRVMEALTHENRIIEIMSDQLKSSEKMQTLQMENENERLKLILENEKQWRETLVQVVAKLGQAAIEATSPVGRSVSSTSFRLGENKTLTVDEPMADAIRSKGELEISDLQRLVLKTDGFIHHNHRINIENPFDPKSYIYADVKDPQVYSVPNIYSECANRKATIEVDVKIATRAGNLEKIYIMNFVQEVVQSDEVSEFKREIE